MLPAQLQAESFAQYPPQARAVASSHLGLLQQMPVVFAPILLRELITYDWRFPVERKELEDQLEYLGSLNKPEFDRLLNGFAQVKTTPEINKLDWVNSPGVFVEHLTAHLWASGQMDSFREAADAYANSWRTARPQKPPPTPRLTVVVIGRGVPGSDYRLFRKLRPQGVYFTRVKPDGGLAALFTAMRDRAAANPEPYAHWYVDGAEDSATGTGLTRLTYAGLQPARAALLKKMQHVLASGNSGPETLRTTLAQLKPQDLGLPADGDAAILSRFQISLLGEGSGTQIFSTTFAQWAAREILRRAQPVSLMVRFAPRQRQQPMNEMLSGAAREMELDPEGSLIDADMAAYYTWLNQQRLPGASSAKFLAWFEDHDQAVAIGPTLPRGTTSQETADLAHILSWL